MKKPQSMLSALCLVAASAGSQSLGPADINALPQTQPSLIEPYGKDPLQFGELRLPAGQGPFPIAVVIHGGCWTRGFATLRNTAPIASALAAKGLATWNIEYRQFGDAGGGWPCTFLDWGAAVDHLRRLSERYPIDLKHVAVIGHSAGAHAALWISARERLTGGNEVGTESPLKIESVFAIDGPADLAAFAGPDKTVCGKPVVAPFMGGTPTERPDRYAQGSPAQLLPVSARQFLVSASVLKPGDAIDHAKLAGEKGNHIQVLYIDTGHFEVIAPGRSEWNSIEGLILANTVAFKADDPNSPSSAK